MWAIYLRISKYKIKKNEKIIEVLSLQALISVKYILAVSTSSKVLKISIYEKLHLLYMQKQLDR